MTCHTASHIAVVESSLTKSRWPCCRRIGRHQRPLWRAPKLRGAGGLPHCRRLPILQWRRCWRASPKARCPLPRPWRHAGPWPPCTSSTATIEPNASHISGSRQMKRQGRPVGGRMAGGCPYFCSCAFKPGAPCPVPEGMLGLGTPA